MINQTLYTTKECSQYLGLSPRSVERLIKTGVLPAYRVAERSSRIAEEDLKNYWDSCKLVNASSSIEAVPGFGSDYRLPKRRRKQSLATA